MNEFSSASAEHDHLELSGSARSPAPELSRRIEAAVKAWKTQLVDLTARNNLLYFRDLKAGTLDFTDKLEHIDRLLSGGELALAQVFGHDTPFAKRARTIRNKAKELFEERGLETMFVAHGLATWDKADEERGRAPAAPVVLVPVSLEPVAQSSSDFALRLAGEPRINPTLLRKLEARFGVSLAAEEFDTELIEVTSVAGLDAVVSRLHQVAAAVPAFDIGGRTVLGTFSYAKLPMVLDLDRAAEELGGHNLIAALCGDPEARSALRKRNETGEPIPIDQPDRTPPEAEHLVLDADSSQSHAINTVLAGRDLIIQGPPGTGKSQTIANLIAALVAEGKSVLFVAEKRAAIDAVFKRLRNVGLQQLLLDMHDGQKRRAPFAHELMSAMEGHRGRGELDLVDAHARLARAREDLNERTAAQHQDRGLFAISVYKARVRREGLPASAQSNLRYRDEQLLALTAEAIREARRLVRQWFSLGGSDLYARDDPWSHAVVDDVAASAQALAAVRRGVDTLASIVTVRNQQAKESGLPAAATPDEWARRLTLAEAVRESTGYFDEQLLTEDLAALCTHLSPSTEGGWTRTKSQLGSSEYRAAKKTVKAALTDVGRDLDRVQRFKRLSSSRDRQAEWRTLAGQGAIPRVAPSLDEARAAERRLAAALEDLRAVAPTLALVDRDWDELDATLGSMARDNVAAGAMAQINPLEDRLRALGLGLVLDEIRSQTLGLELALARLDYVWLSSIVEHFELTDRWVSAVKGPEQTITEFQHLDRDHIAAGAARVLRACAKRSVMARDEHRDQAMLVERQAKLKPRSRRHLPIREFFAQAPGVLRALKPCWAMSPLVVSQTLPAQRDLFDVVIFDEASQVTPADAIPAILRGRQLVVAGDSRQLPPTTFFAQAVDDEDDEELSADAGTIGYESILDALGGLIPERMLTWHYRSHDERLIAFSNIHIYDRALTTFPGVHTDDVIRHELVPWQPDEEDREDSRAAEVDRVVDLIVDHVLDRPGESLGVIAMGLKHAERIADELRRRRDDWRAAAAEAASTGHDDADEDPDDGEESVNPAELTVRLDKFLDERREEVFFVKNLERVQGDERDAIILTAGYGKEPATGRMLYHFGPLLQDGGERRLNVAITRAKRRMVVVSSFSADDLDPDKLNKDGAKLLRRYLSYAASQGRDLGDEHSLPPELNPFEIAVRDALSARAMALTAQFGASGYRIDFAAQHPDDPGRYVLAIECDGASYHSSPTARERDRLRQEHLERLGWRFCRIWSSDWFNDRDREIARVLQAYEDALRGAGADEEDNRGTLGPPSPPAHATARPRGPRPRTHDTYSPGAIVDLLEWIERDTLPRTRGELFWEVLRELGFERAGNKIKPAIEAALAIHRGEPIPTPVTVIAPASTAHPPRRSVISTAPPSIVAEASAASPAGEIGDHAAVRIRYLPKNGTGPGTDRVINPLVVRGDLMWSWCHKLGDVRCFNIRRIRDWHPESPDQWLPPPDALAVAQEKVRDFRPGFEYRRRRHA